METAGDDFEFLALNEAINYRRALLQEFGPYLKGDVLEVGAGAGQLSEGIVRVPGVSRLHAVEPCAAFVTQLKARELPIEITEGTVCDIAPATRYNAIVSVNVLEHIEEDAAELRRYREKLSPGSFLCLFVPACPSIYAPMDRIFGHYRRYTRAGLRALLVDAGFTIERIHFYNSLGYLMWWLNFCVLKKTTFEVAKVRLYDRRLFPLVHGLERHVLWPPIGQSLLAVGRA